MTLEPGGRIVYDIKDVLGEINTKLADFGGLYASLERRLGVVESRVAAHDKILTEQLPLLTKFMEDMNVRQQVEEALDARKLRGSVTSTRVLVAGIGACSLLVGIVAGLPHIIGA